MEKQQRKILNQRQRKKWSQAEGVYEYFVSFSGGLNQSGKCGHVTNHEIGKRLTLVVHADLTVRCEESSKVLHHQ